MRVETSADWRGSIPFESPMIVEDLVPGDPTRCVTCGMSSEPLPRNELWAFKHRHPNHHDGFVRFYCRTHVPVVERREEPPAAKARRKAAPKSERTVAPRRVQPTDVPPRAMCPDCFIEVSAQGVCGVCGATIA